MSSPDTPELKAGHPPAVKAGGMRVTSRPRTTSGSEVKMTKEEQEEFGTGSPKTDPKHNQHILLSGVVTQGDKDFSDKAVKKFHEAPLPKHEKRPAARPVHNIQQPQ
uniref:Death-associated protein 1 n=1 Tax=Capitella teleta TaxID=283909 RepID=X2B920_CAPTE